METAAVKIEKPEFIIIEDDEEQAIGYSNDLKLGNGIKEIFLTNENQVSELVLNKEDDGCLSFLIDINLGKGKHGGLKAIKEIRINHPNDLIIAYSSNFLEEETKDIGADFFIQKNSDTYVQDMKDIKNIIVGSITNEKDINISSSLLPDYKSFTKKRSLITLLEKPLNTVFSEELEDSIKLNILEDDLEETQDFFSHLSLGNEVKEMAFTNIKQISHVLDESEKQIFWIDINLEKANDGLRSIREIKNRHEASPVIVFSACDAKEEAKDAGADFFFQKEGDDYTADIANIRNIILGILNNKTAEELSLKGDHRSDYEKYCEKYLEQFLDIEIKTLPITLKITKMKGDKNTAGYIYLSKKILSARDSSDTLWVAGNQVWEVEYEEISSKIKPSPSVSKNGISHYEITFDSKSNYPIKLIIVKEDGERNLWDLSSLENIDRKFRDDYKYDFSTLAKKDKILYNIIIAQACAQEYVKDGGNKKLVKSLAGRLDDAVGKLEIQKWLSIYYATKLRLSKNQIKNKFKEWTDYDTFPEIIDLFNGRLKKVKNKKKIGIVELKSIFTGKKSVEYFDYSKLLVNNIIREEDCFLFTAYKPREGSHAADIEPQDYKSTV